MKLKELVLLSCIIFNIDAACVIMFMGPSCAGKSTLSKYVCQELNAINKEWVVIDFDEVEESIELLITTTNHYLKKNINIIIDTNTYEDTMEEKFEGAVTITKIIVTAPLEVLLKRDEKRTECLNRNENRADRCRQFVIDSFHESLTWASDLIIDSSQQSVQDAWIKIITFFKRSS